MQLFMVNGYERFDYSCLMEKTLNRTSQCNGRNSSRFDDLPTLITERSQWLQIEFYSSKAKYYVKHRFNPITLKY